MFAVTGGTKMPGCSKLKFKTGDASRSFRSSTTFAWADPMTYFAWSDTDDLAAGLAERYLL